MKATKAVTPLGHAAALIAACSLSLTCASAQSPAPATLNISPGSNVTVTVNDPANHVWIIQSSTDLQQWSEAATFKVFNGNFHGRFDSSAPQDFFRAFYNESRDGLLSSVSEALRLPTVPFNYAAPQLPPYFFQPPVVNQDNMPATNVTTDAGAALGRVLFYDKRLSTNQTISCSSCHQARFGFSDPRKFSVGFNGGITARNAMGLTQARYYQRGHFFWDERSNTLEDQVLQPIQNAVEMGMTLPALVTRLSAEPYYITLFNQVFGSPEVTSERISLALAQF